MNSFNLRALALTSGITYAICLVLLAWSGAYGWGLQIVDLLANFYTGYDITAYGAFLGAIWGFVVGFVFGAVFGYFYNYLAKRCKKKLF